eukprot:1468687-Rhodomonas_salina.4
MLVLTPSSGHRSTPSIARARESPLLFTAVTPMILSATCQPQNRAHSPVFSSDRGATRALWLAFGTGFQPSYAAARMCSRQPARKGTSVWVEECVACPVHHPLSRTGGTAAPGSAESSRRATAASQRRPRTLRSRASAGPAVAPGKGAVDARTARGYTSQEIRWNRRSTPAPLARHQYLRPESWPWQRRSSPTPSGIADPWVPRKSLGGLRT